MSANRHTNMDGPQAMRTTALARAVALLSLGLAALALQSANVRAADATADEEDKTGKLEEIEVTGTHIRGTITPAAPVNIITREEIRRDGYASVRELIDSLPQNYAGGMSENTRITPNIDANRNAGATSTVDLRGLGTGSTLTLLNGHRLAPNGEGFAVDVSAIPLSAIKRVEIVSDGASAVYGSDAVGGVVNFILDDEFDGAESEVQYGGATRGNMTETRASQTLGGHWKSGHALATLEYYQRDPLLVRDQGFASQAPPSYFLTADQHRGSAVFHLDQQFTAATTGFADVLASDQTKVLNTPFDTVAHDRLKSLSVAGGVKRELPHDWLIELSGLYGRQTDSQQSLPLPPQAGSESDFKNDVWAADLKSDGSLMSLPGGTAKAAFGFGFRREGLAARESGVDSASRETKSAYIELWMPLIGTDNAIRAVKHLDLTVAGRIEDYSDFGSTANPKIGLVWTASDSLRIRGTWGTSFKAPTLWDRYGATTAFIFDLPDSTGNTRSLVGLGANRDLGPEKAHTWTAGLDYKPASVPDLIVSTTYFDTVYRDRITIVDADIFNILPNQALYPTAVLRNPSVAFINAYLANATEVINAVGPFDPSEIAAFVRAFPLNVALYRTSGLDMLAKYDRSTSAGQFSENLNATYYLKASQHTTLETPAINRVDQLFYLPALRFRAGGSWTRAAWSTALSLNYTKSYTNGSVEPRETIDSYTTVDTQVSFAPQSLWGGGFRISLSALNVLDEQPPRVSTPLYNYGGVQFGFDPANANPIGRFLTLQLSKRW